MLLILNTGEKNYSSSFGTKIMTTNYIDEHTSNELSDDDSHHMSFLFLNDFGNYCVLNDLAQKITTFIQKLFNTNGLEINNEGIQQYTSINFCGVHYSHLLIDMLSKPCGFLFNVKTPICIKE